MSHSMSKHKTKTQKRVEKCIAEVNKILKKHNCVLNAQYVISEQGNKAMVNVVALEDKKKTDE